MTSQASSSTTTNKIYLILLRRSKAFHKGKIVSKNCNISKTPGRDFIDPQLPPAPLCHGGGMNLLVRPRVKTPDRRLISNPEFFAASFPVVLSDFRCDVTCQSCREKSHYRAIALGCKPPLVTRIAWTGLGTRLSFLDVSVSTYGANLTSLPPPSFLDAPSVGTCVWVYHV